MAKRYNQNQKEKVRDKFSDHPYYKLCKKVFDKFYERMPTMMMSAEDLFRDSASILDNILTEPEKADSRCESLWNDTYQDYRNLETSVGTEQTKAEIAMLLYCVMLALANVQDHDFRRFSTTLHLKIHTFYKAECKQIEPVLLSAVSQYNGMMRGWVTEYFLSDESLSREFELLFRSSQSKPSANRREKEKHYTLWYDCSIGDERIYRIDIVRRKLEAWNWIENNTSVEDFEHFFEGQSRDCNIKWIGRNTTILTILMDRLLKQEYMKQYTGCSASSLVRKQFQVTPNWNQDRLEEVELRRIDFVVLILDYRIPLDLPKIPGSQIDDITDSALQEVLSGHLHITKDLRKNM